MRLEFFGDEIETMRRFDPATQRTVRPGDLNEPDRPAMDRVLVTPAREYLTPLQSAPPDGDETWHEFHIPFLHPLPASLLDYLPGQVMVFLDDWYAIADAIGEVEEQSLGLRRDFIKDGILPEDLPIPYLTISEFMTAFPAYQPLIWRILARLRRVRSPNQLIFSRIGSAPARALQDD